MNVIWPKFFTASKAVGFTNTRLWNKVFGWNLDPIHSPPRVQAAKEDWYKDWGNIDKSWLQCNCRPQMDDHEDFYYLCVDKKGEFVFYTGFH